MLIEAYWLSLIASCLLLLVFSTFSDLVPKPLLLLGSYGKNLSGAPGGPFSWLYIPKKAFTTFYAVGLWWCLTVLIVCTWAKSANAPPSDWLVLRLCRYASDFSFNDGAGLPAGIRASPSISSTECLVALGMMVFQTTRRLYEQIVVQRSSASSKILLHQYVFGLTFYIVIPLTIVTSSPFIADDHLRSSTVSSGQYARYTCSILVFLWASYKQYACHVTLASLRRNGDSRYSLPRGGWFEWVSSPHYLAEIIIYLSIAMVVGNGMTWWFAVAAVVTNLSNTAINTHRWYKRKFPGYPAIRKAIVPFVL